MKTKTILAILALAITAIAQSPVTGGWHPHQVPQHVVVTLMGGDGKPCKLDFFRVSEDTRGVFDSTTCPTVIEEWKDYDWRPIK